MNINEYNESVRRAIARDKAVNKMQDVSNLGRTAARTVTGADGKKITLRLYGR